MAAETFRLGSDFFPEDVVGWYHRSEVNDRVHLELPGRACALQLIACPNNLICWWPEGERGVSGQLDDTVRRLEMLQNG